MRHQLLLAILLAVNCGAALAERPRIGLVLGGGGARGFAHVGVLKVLEENHIPVDCIVGTSIGSLVGAAYAAGRSPAEMEKRILAANWDDLLSSTLPRQVNTFRKKQDDALSLLKIEVGVGDDGQVKLPSAAISTQKIEFFLRDLTFAGTVADFDHLAIPYRAIATDLETGEMVVQGDGDLVTAMRASMAVPGVFPAVSAKGKMLVDGGLVRNLPVDVARQTCADVVIAVDVGSSPLKRDQINDIFSVADQYTRLMMVQNVRPQIESLTTSDLLITPEFGKINSSDFKKGAELIALGEQAALAALPQLKRFTVPAEQYSVWKNQHINNRLQPKLVKDIAVSESKLINSDVLKNALDLQVDAPLDVDPFHQKLAEVYARGDYSQLDYELLHQEDGQKVSLLPVEKSWGPNYLNFGLSLGTDFAGSSPWNLNAQYRRTWINSLGAEWKTTAQVGSSSLLQTEFYQPLQLDGYAFVAPYLRYYNTPLAIWYHDSQLSEYSYSKTSAGFDVGSGLSKYGEVRVGAVANSYSGMRLIGQDVIKDQRNYDYGVKFNSYYDQLDSYYFPKNGEYLNAYGYYSLGGSDDLENYARIGFVFKKAMPLETGSLLLTLKAQDAIGDNQPVSDIKWLGGFLNLSSYRYQQILGNEFVYGSAQYLLPIQFLSGSYFGTALEVGRVFDTFDPELAKDWHYSATMYLAYDSYLGPIYFGAAYGDNKQARYYLMLGKQF